MTGGEMIAASAGNITTVSYTHLIGAHTGRGIMGAICFDANDGKYAKYQ